MTEPLRALSVRQPWAHAIVALGKDIENRSRHYAHRGPTLIHASAGLTAGEYDSAIEFMERAGIPARDQIPCFATIDRGGIVGAVEITDSVGADAPQARSPWWMGPCGLLLSNARTLPFVPCRGTIAPMFWIPDEETRHRIDGARLVFDAKAPLISPAAC